MARWEEGGDRLVFRPPGKRRFLVVFLLLGAAAIAGFALTRGHALSSFVASFLEMLLAIGVLFFVVAAGALTSREGRDPPPIVFDKRRGVIEFGPAQIPFGELVDVEVRKQPAVTRRDGAITTTTHWHHIVAAVTTSAKVDLFSSLDPIEAERVVTAVRACMGADSGEEVRADPPLAIETRDGATMFRFRNAAVRPLFTFVVAVAAIGFVLSRFYALFSEMGGLGPAMIVFVFFGIVLAIVVFTQLRRMLRDLRTTYEVTIGPAVARYAQQPAGRVVEISPATDLEVNYAHVLWDTPGPITVSRGNASFSFDVASLTSPERIILARFLRECARGGSYR